MPSEQTAPTSPVLLAAAPPQIKLCATCTRPLTDAPELLFAAETSPADVALVCSACADRTRARAHERAVADALATPGARVRPLSVLEPTLEEAIESDPESSSSGHPHTPPTDPCPAPAGRLTPLSIPSRSPVRSPVRILPYDIRSSPPRPPHSLAGQYRSRPLASPPLSRGTPARPDLSAFNRELDPFADVTHIRLNHTRQDCLYPGASFVGIQKSGRNSYNVSVTIVNVDFPGSTLCGYLTIENLTDDHPQLTTYFDAEIIGPKYGFLTQGYGASETDDMTHWGRFDPFRGLKSEMRRPGLTIRQKSLSERGFVFMRWKERFLVPDHQVRGIRGASYDGFYYVCVQLNSQAEPPIHTHSPFHEPVSPVQTYHPLPSQQPAPAPTPLPPIRTRTTSSTSARLTGPMSPEVLHSSEEFPPLLPNPRPPPVPTSPPSPRTARPHSSSFRGSGSDVWGSGARGSSARPAATMTGFYFHQNSEPYQQLTLHHQPERAPSVFEFR